MEALIAAGIAFVGSHFLLSHPLRRPLVGAIGEGPFLGLYSLVAFATLGWMAHLYAQMPMESLWWLPDDTIWAIASAVMLFASILFVGSLFGNPAFPRPGAAPVVGTPKGVFAITRHPMMWGFALWAIVHLAIFPTNANAVLTGAILILALVGAALQDRKKAALFPDVWPEWEARTAYFPFARQLAGRAAWTLGSPLAIVLGTALWLGATYAHIPLASWAAGVWRWLV